MGVGVGEVVNYTNTTSGTATGVVDSTSVGGQYTYVAFSSAFSPASLFAAGEQGAWYDPSDLTTLFQDSAGTTPVTLSPMEQPVGLMRDKSGRNNHAFQATTTNRPLLSARVNLLLATATLSTQSVTSQATNYTLSFTGTGTVTLSGTATATLSAGSNTFTATAGTLTLTVSGSVTLADLRPTNSGALLPPYQRVTTATDYDTAGFPLYLKCNGTSSAMSTNSINFTATDKMTVVTGVRKLSDTGYGMIVELSNAWDMLNTGTFAVSGSNTTRHRFGTAGTTAAYYDASTYVSPISNVLTLLSDIGQSGISTEIIPRINGIVNQTNPNGTSCGTGTFGNYPLYLFARAGTSLQLSGYFYGAVIRGATTDTAALTSTENYMAQKTGITF